MLTRAQLGTLGVARSTIRRRVARGDWRELGPTVVCTHSGVLSGDQLLWLGFLAAGENSAVGELTAATQWGLRRWERDEVVIMLPHREDLPPRLAGVRFHRTRRDLRLQVHRHRGLPMVRIEPAILTWAGRQRSGRTTEGVLAAAVQQGLTSAALLAEWIDRLSPLPQAPRMRRALAEIGGGAQSVGELDVRRMCRQFALVPPTRQVRRRDAQGRLRFTDCEWSLPGGLTLVLEVDGGFHMEAEHWEDDLARQRALTSPTRMVVRCTTRELRDEPARVAADLRLLGVPAA